MKNLIVLLLVIICLPVFSQVNKPDYIKSTGFFVYDGRIYNPDGSEFIMRGVNQNHFWGNETFNLNSINGIANAHANVVRVVMSNQDWVNQSRDNAKKRMLVEKYIDIGVAPMVELHDGTCEKSPSFIEEMTDSWTHPDNVEWLNEYEEYVILNIANEWGPADNDADWQIWRDTYKAAITQIREAGINNMIVIDSPGCGQKPRAMQVYGQELIDHDPQHNVVLSIHFYGHWRTQDRDNETGEPNDNDSPWLVETELQTMLDLKLPVICGEFSWKEADSCPYDTETIIQFCEEKGIGWVAWSWNGNGNELLDMVKGWQYESDDDLKEYGKLIINHPLYGFRATSVQAAVFGPANQRPTVTLTALTEGQTFTEGANIPITASIQDTDGQVVRTALYVNGHKVTEQNSATFDYTWENVSRGRYSLFVLAEDDAGEYGHSTIIEIKVGFREQTKSALFVANSSNIRTGDAMTKERLEILGYNVTVVADDSATLEQADEMDVVLISSSIAPTRVSDTFKDALCPVICWEAYIFDDMGMTARGTNTGYGKSRATGLDIINTEHPMAAQQSGTVELFAENYLTWGAPAESADIISIIADTDHPAIFIYEKGDELVSGETAIAPRVGLFLYDTAVEYMQLAGWQLFDAAIDYVQTLPADVETLQHRPNTLDLAQNYPNPFNPVTTIAYSVPESGKVILSVYNLNGELVETLINSHHKAGHYSSEWNAQDYASGIYFYTLQIGQQFAGKRMLLVK